jgi:hypothetical protein
MHNQYSALIRNSLLLPGFALMLASPGASAPQGEPDRRRDADWAPTSVELRVSARHRGAPRFRVIDNGATLQVGDEVRITMTAEELTYAYIFHRGSGGDWSLIFPNPEDSGDPAARNPLLPGEVCLIPGENSKLVVGGDAGTEELVIYALPRPDRAVLDDLAARLRRGEHPRIQLDHGAPVAAPGRQGESVLAEMPDLTFVPSEATGEVKLPLYYAVHLKYHNGGSLPAGRIP